MIPQILRLLSTEETRATDFAATDHLDLFRVRKAGQSITPDSVVAISAVWASLRLISEGVGSLPAHAYRARTDGFRDRMPVEPKWLNDPNPSLRLSRQDLVSNALVSLLLRGNAYLFIQRAPGSRLISGLEVLNPDLVTPQLSLGRQNDPAPRGWIQYIVNGVVYGPQDVLHIRGLTMPGEIEGLDPITHAAATMGTAIAAQEYGSNFFENASLPPAYIAVPGALSEAGASLMKKAWERLHQGSVNSGRVAVLTEGAEFRPLSLTPEQTQFIDTKRFSIQDIARIFGIPPHLLADSSNSTSWGSGLAEQNTAFSKMTLTPWVQRLDWAFTWLLRSEGRLPNAFIRFHLEGFERGSYSDRIDTYAAGLAAGIYTIDEIRGWEDLPPLDTSPPTPEENP